MASAPNLRLNTRSRLSEADRDALEGLSRSAVQRVAARRDVVREGDKSHQVRLLLEGWACRYKSTRDGQRQVVGFFIPGDFCDLNVFGLSHMDHSVGAITALQVAQIPPERLEALAAERPRIALAFWRNALVDASIQREWLLNVGRRSAYERIGHLLVELFYRMRAAGLAQGDSGEFPLTQTDLADATGLTSVHVNRTLQELRRDGLVQLERKRLRLPDLSGLAAASGFNPDYLHLDHEGRHIGVYA